MDKPAEGNSQEIEKQEKLDAHAKSLLIKGNMNGFNKLRDENPEYKPRLDNINVANVDLTHANLSGVSLKKVFFYKVNLADVNLTGAKCSGFFTDVEFFTVKMAGTNFEGSYFSRCRFFQCDFSGALGLTPIKLSVINDVQLENNTGLSAEFLAQVASCAKIKGDVDRVGSKVKAELAVATLAKSPAHK